MIRYKILIEYDGSKFCGWQRQSSTNNTVQQVLEEAIFAFSSQSVEIYGGGRTDAGVHALGQVAHFDLSDISLSKFRVMSAINYHLKKYAVVIRNIEEISENFHARFCAKFREYQYKIIVLGERLVIDSGRAWRIRMFPDIDLMRETAQVLLGRHNFSAFRSARCQGGPPVRTLSSLNIDVVENKIYINIAARSFLQNQVRIIVGTLIAIGKNEMIKEDVSNALLNKIRIPKMITAPADGLYLMKINY